VSYTDVVSKPIETARNIYKYFDFEMSEKFDEALSHYHLESKKYKSKHTYSMAQYGVTKETINEQLGDLMDEFDFSRDIEA
jgi:hypothetical protein